MIVTIGNTKGGVGKSTIAINLAIAHALAGRDVWLIDADAQGTAQAAIGMRAAAEKAPGIACAHYPDGATLRAQLRLQKDRFGDVVIDAGGRDSSALRVALALSDVVVAPFAPRSFDVWALNDLAALAEEALAINEHLRCLAVLNCADPGRSPDNTEAEAAVRDAPPFTYLPTPLCRRKVFGNAAASGLCVTEHRPKDTKAVMEFQALYKALFGGGTANI